MILKIFNDWRKHTHTQVKKQYTMIGHRRCHHHHQLMCIKCSSHKESQNMINSKSYTHTRAREHTFATLLSVQISFRIEVNSFECWCWSEHVCMLASHQTILFVFPLFHSSFDVYDDLHVFHLHFWPFMSKKCRKILKLIAIILNNEYKTRESLCQRLEIVSSECCSFIVLDGNAHKNHLISCRVRAHLTPLFAFISI